MKKSSRIACATGLAALLLVPLSMFEAQAKCILGWEFWGHSGKIYTGGQSNAGPAKIPYASAKYKARQNWSEKLVQDGYGEGFSHWEWACNKTYYCYSGSDWGGRYYACDVVANPGEPYRRVQWRSSNRQASPLLAYSGHAKLHRTCPLSRVKQT